MPHIFVFLGTDPNTSHLFLQHLALKCLPNQIKSLLPDIIQVHCGRHGRTIVFCQTKKECDDLASNTLHKMRAQVLHGDIAQAKRDIVIKVCMCSLNIIEPRHEKTCLRGIVTRVDSDLPVQPQKLGRGFKFRIWKLEVLYYLDSEQQRG